MGQMRLAQNGNCESEKRKAKSEKRKAKSEKRKAKSEKRKERFLTEDTEGEHRGHREASGNPREGKEHPFNESGTSPS
jgi:hypothetical protein